MLHVRKRRAASSGALLLQADILTSARALPWLPAELPHHAGSHTPYVLSLIEFLQAGPPSAACGCSRRSLRTGPPPRTRLQHALCTSHAVPAAETPHARSWGHMAQAERCVQGNAGLVQGSLPAEAAHAVLRGLVGYLGSALVALLQEDGLQAFNLLAMHRLADDVATLGQACERDLGSVPGLQARLPVPLQRRGCPCQCSIDSRGWDRTWLRSRASALPLLH